MFLRDVLPIMRVLCKIREASFGDISLTLNVYCKDGEDNLGSRELTRLPNFKSYTKHKNVCYQYFQKHVVRLRKVQNFLPPNKFDIIDDNGHLGCGYIHPSFLFQLLENPQSAQALPNLFTSIAKPCMYSNPR